MMLARPLAREVVRDVELQRRAGRHAHAALHVPCRAEPREGAASDLHYYFLGLLAAS